ncbi:MAG: hypothetical protein SFT90_02660 [Rickettsiales bacterium]|nr:hypothetical protein [Rickettsiales bacterium]
MRFAFKIILVIIFFYPLNIFASAWNLPKGKIQTIHSFYYNKITQLYDREGIKRPQGDFLKYEYKPYLGYGILEDLTIGFSPSMQMVQAKTIFGDFTDSNYGLVFTEFFGRINLLRENNHIISTELGFELPGFYSSRETPEFGTKDFFTSAKISYGLGGSFYFLNLDTAIRNRPYDNLDFRDERAGVQSINTAKIGLDYKQEYKVELGVMHTKSLSNYARFTNTARYGFDVTRSEINLIKKIGQSEVVIGFMRDIEGRNVGKSRITMLSLRKSF